MWEAIYMLFVQMHLFDTQYERIFSLMPYNSVGYMYLGNAVIQALEIFGVGFMIITATLLFFSKQTYDRFHLMKV